MTLFDAIAHSFTTISTGGFSTHNNSFAYFQSNSILNIAIVFMIIGSILSYFSLKQPLKILLYLEIIR